MSHAYPIAETLEGALQAHVPAARTRAEAEARAGGLIVEALLTDWLTLAPEKIDAILATPYTQASGHLQRYEDETGRPVVAITWWRLATAAALAKPGKRKAARKGAVVADVKLPKPTPPEEDHTDDLYFRSGRTRTRGKSSDPNQLDFFAPPDKT